jgi:hypothetical protein
MPGPALHLGAVVTCTHAGPAQPAAPFPRVLLSGQPLVTIASPYVVTGCALTGTPTPPCVTGQWLVGAARVLAGGECRRDERLLLGEKRGVGWIREDLDGGNHRGQDLLDHGSPRVGTPRS